MPYISPLLPKPHASRSSMDLYSAKCRELLEGEIELTDDVVKSFIKEHSGLELTAPEIEVTDDEQWVNSTPISIHGDTKIGGYVLLDFFTYCCINCMHILPALHDLEQVDDSLTVIGVHSGKFQNEKDTTNILNAIERYGITHPVVNDGDYTIWNSYQVICWPTLVLINPQGRIMMIAIGESQINRVCQFVRCTLRLFSAGDIIGSSVAPVVHQRGKEEDGLHIRYPGKVHYDVESNSIFVSGTVAGKGRVLQVTTDGVIIQTFSGSLAAAPQGLCTYNSRLYVCDTTTHRIISYGLEGGVEELVCGTGQQGKDLQGGKPGPEQEIASPWDITPVKLDHIAGCSGTILVICAAGTHQLWGYALTDVTIKMRGNLVINKLRCTAWRLAGDGKEMNRNNTYAEKASFAQPSGVTFDGKDTLYIADAEGSAIRIVSLPSFGVKNVAGGGLDPTDLFTFGDENGKGAGPRFQHPLDVEWMGDGVVTVADSYNHKLKSVKNRFTFDLSQGYKEPGGISYDRYTGSLFVADTNSHRVVRRHEIDGRIEVLDIKRGRPILPCPGRPVTFLNTKDVDSIKLSVSAGDGRHLNLEESGVGIKCHRGISTHNGEISLSNDFPLQFKLDQGCQNFAVDLDFKVISCSEEGTCHIDWRRHRLNISVDHLPNGGAIHLTLP